MQTQQTQQTPDKPGLSAAGTVQRRSSRITKAMRAGWYFERMSSLGFSWGEANDLRLIEKTLKRWAVRECGDGSNWGIERDDTGKPWNVYHGEGKPHRYPIADREAGALRRAKAILDRHSELWMYHQCDCRGAMLYVGRIADIIEPGTGLQLPLSSHYTRGVAVCAD